MILKKKYVYYNLIKDKRQILKINVQDCKDNLKNYGSSLITLKFKSEQKIGRLVIYLCKGRRVKRSITLKLNN